MGSQQTADEEDAEDHRGHGGVGDGVEEWR